ncbi:MAG: hypothetical protein EAZ95_07675 [Bacteroidetes bacterium]|nr:MAG: hypothetical protein EAZ95_07675 [Bacteroidota bacterium]
MLIYDQAKRHFLGNFPTVLPIEQAYVHIGMFMGWMLDNELYSEMFEDEEGHQLLRFQRREVSCSLLSAMWDGYLGEDLFNEEGNAFSVYYYQSGMYRKDYQRTLAENLPSFYHVEDSWDNFEKMSEVITSRYEEWKKAGKTVNIDTSEPIEA